MFRRPTDLVLPSEKWAKVEPEVTETLAVVRGRLGETPTGPLFTHVIDPLAVPEGFVITGLGAAWSFTPAAFGAFVRAGQRALDEMAGAQAA
jgi:hypothetical protein